jgi:hypothetical protein
MAPPLHPCAVCKTQLPISLFHAMQPPVSIELCVCRVFSANTIVEDADGNYVRACVKAGATDWGPDAREAADASLGTSKWQAAGGLCVV